MSDIRESLLGYKKEQDKKRKGSYIYRASDKEIVDIFDSMRTLYQAAGDKSSSFTITEYAYDSTGDLDLLKAWFQMGVRLYGLDIIPDKPTYKTNSPIWSA